MAAAHFSLSYENKIQLQKLPKIHLISKELKPLHFFLSGISILIFCICRKKFSFNDISNTHAD